jgi:hypothetical protein
MQGLRGGAQNVIFFYLAYDLTTRGLCSFFNLSNGLNKRYMALLSHRVPNGIGFRQSRGIAVARGAPDLQ